MVRRISNSTVLRGKRNHGEKLIFSSFRKNDFSRDTLEATRLDFRAFQMSELKPKVRSKMSSRNKCSQRSSKVLRRVFKRCSIVLASATGVCAAALYFLDSSVKAMEIETSLPSYPWKFREIFTSLDHSALRRGWQVYKMVCHTCHGLRRVRFMDLVNVSHTESEAKAIAAEFEVTDGPDIDGNYYKRPGNIQDAIPSPFPTEEAARAANSGAYPPDLSYNLPSRRNGANYVFSLLTGWMEPPAGIKLEDGQHFNVYFPGGVTSMGKMIDDGVLEYEDGTPATQSQIAKDIVEFLTWTSSQDHDTRKLMAIKAIGIIAIMLPCAWHVYRVHWSLLRSRQIAFVPKQKA